MCIWGPRYIRIGRKIKLRFQLLVISSVCLKAHFELYWIDMCLYRVDGRRGIRCKRNIFL